MKKLLTQGELVLKDSQKNISLLANAAAFLKEFISEINWVGFYLFEEGKLFVGPFQGKLACSPIELDKGVCGFSFSNDLIVNVPDVDDFSGHITCDENSKSELVIPLKKAGRVFGLLDIDSPILDRFDEETEEFFVRFSEIIVKYYNL